MNRLCKTQVTATSQTQWVAFTYPALMPQQDLWQIPLMATAQGAVLHFHSPGSVCLDITSLHFPLICDSRPERVYKAQGCLSDQISWKHTQHQHYVSYLNQQHDGQSLLRAHLLPLRGKESVGEIHVKEDFVCLHWTAWGKHMLMLKFHCIFLRACLASVQLHMWKINKTT